MALQVFISYSSKDKNWLDELLDFLKPVCNDLNVALWHDAIRLAPGDSWDSTIRQAILRSRVSIALVSQAYLASTYVNEVELPKILELHQKQQSALFWVPVGFSTYELTSLKDLQAAIGNPKSPLEGLSSSERNRLWKELANKLHEHLHRLDAGSGAASRKVYLSEPAAEPVIRTAYKRLNKELSDFGYRIVPDHPLPSLQADAEIEIRSAMGGADLVLGLFGGRLPPHGFNLLKLEHQVAAELGIPRLLWIPGSEPREGDSDVFAASLRDYGAGNALSFRLAPGYLWRSSHLDDFLEDIHGILKDQRDRQVRAGQDHNPPTVYLICAEKNHPASDSAEAATKVERIKAYLEDKVRRIGRQPYSVFLPPMSIADLDDLLEAEAFILYWGDGDYKDYFWNNLQVFQKAVGKRVANNNPYRAKILYLTDPKLRDKALYPKHRFSVVEQYGDEAFKPEELEQFL